MEGGDVSGSVAYRTHVRAEEGSRPTMTDSMTLAYDLEALDAPAEPAVLSRGFLVV